MRRMECARRAVNFYERAIERLDGKWAGRGESGARFRNPQHPYADDLDLFVPGGVFEMLSLARTRAGENTLASWLMQPAAIDTLHGRHQAIGELRDKIDLREDLFVLGQDVTAGVNPEALVAWATQPLVCVSRAQGTLMKMLGAVGIVTLGFLIGSEFMGLWQRIAMMILVLVNLGVMFYYRKIVERITTGLEHPAQDLALFSSVLARVEREQFTSPLLSRLRTELNVEGEPASHRIARLNRIVELIDSRENFFVKLLEPVVLWTPQLMFVVEAWRARSGAYVPRWVAATGEIEALASLAGYAFDHPQDPFPEFVANEPVFDAVELAHPLLVGGVPNDLRLDSSRPLLLVSGSNMSGKSTLLRAVGVNTLLALAGAPCGLAACTSLRCIRAHPSGLPTRCKREVPSSTPRSCASAKSSICPAPHCFFWMSCCMGPTRLIAKLELKASCGPCWRAARSALSRPTTLRLADIAGARNVHFEDRIENGKILFDYRLREGVVEHSNALDLMRAVGLDV